MRTGEFAEALRAYLQLEQAEPHNPAWPQRQAQAYAGLLHPEEQLASLQRAAEIAIDVGNVIAAITICKEILTLDPDHSQTLDRLHLLYCEASPKDESQVQPPAPNPTRKLRLPQSAPLVEVLLTEIIPGSHASDVNESGDPGISVIPLNRPGDTQRAHQELLETPLFGSLDSNSLREVIHEVRLVELAEGEVLFRQGDHADALYVVSEGAVVPIAEEDSRKKLAVLEAGSFFGEAGLITKQPRNATIRAMVDTTLLAIDRKSMWAIIRKHPGVLQILLGFLRDRMVDRLVRTHPFFATFPSARRATVAKLFRFLEVQPEMTLIEQGRPAENLYVLLTGRVEIVKSTDGFEKVIAELEPGNLFGEMSLLTGEAAVASVVALEKCWILALSSDHLHRLLKHNDQLERVIESLALSRSRQNRVTTGAVDIGGEK